MQYNTCFWALVLKGGRTPAQAQDELKVRVPLVEPSIRGLVAFAQQQWPSQPLRCCELCCKAVQHELLLLFIRPCLLLCLVQGTGADVKNEMLYTKFGINYNALPEQFKKVGF